jgi:hypothetical protein
MSTNPMKTIFDDLTKWGTGFVNGEFVTKLVYKGVGKDPVHLHNPS